MTAHQVFQRVDNCLVFGCVRGDARACSARLDRDLPGHLHRNTAQIIAERPDVELELTGRPRREAVIGAHVVEVEEIVHGKAGAVRRVVVLGVVLACRSALRSREHKPRTIRTNTAPRGTHSIVRGKPGQACKDGNNGSQHKQTAHQEILPEILEGPHMLVGSLAVLGRRLVLLGLAMSVHVTHRLRLPCLRACHPFRSVALNPLVAGREFRQNTTLHDKLKE